MYEGVDMAYLALYREWRPRLFCDLVGQEHVKRTLTNALLHNKVAHAYLFCGPRGTGKTTAAKILAKALNCSSRQGAEPCNECDTCQGIDQGTAMDVLEIDAASNRGIDEIRNLRDNVKLASTSGEYKVYIIDEVHMLTPEAFNALLKTLEEPPSGVIFIMATTEPHKVPLTILSRVQRFEFHRISPEMIVQRLQEVCDSLNRKITEEALMVIAAKAEGGLRDALSILDQCLLNEGDITLEYVFDILGIVGESFSADLFDAILEGDCGLVLTKLNEATTKGRDPRQIIRELLDYLRQGLLFGAGGQEPMLSVQMKSRLTEQVHHAGIDKIMAIINVLLKGEGELRFAPNARLSAEMILVQAVFEGQGYSETTSVKPPKEKTRLKNNESKSAETLSTSTELLRLEILNLELLRLKHLGKRQLQTNPP
jgi:DNA polymerase-3 subunit gamma/tau